jgi:exosortase
VLPSQQRSFARPGAVAEASAPQEPPTLQLSRGLDAATRQRHSVFTLLVLLSLVAFWTTVTASIGLYLRDDRYSYALFAVPITVFLMYSQRAAVFLSPRYEVAGGVGMILLGASSRAVAAAISSPFSRDVRLSGSVLALVLVWVGAFLLCYGKDAFRKALVPLLFLFLLVPLPSAVMDKAVVALQHASAGTTYVLFKLLRIPVLAQGVNLSLPGANIEIAKECSGIRSGESLVITCILAGYYLLQSAWSRVGLVLLSVPVAILKNALRITTISCLGIYVDPAFFYGKLHRNGGLPFSIVALAMVALVLFLFRRWETHSQKSLQSQNV